MKLEKEAEELREKKFKDAMESKIKSLPQDEKDLLIANFKEKINSEALFYPTNNAARSLYMTKEILKNGVRVPDDEQNNKGARYFSVRDECKSAIELLLF